MTLSNDIYGELNRVEEEFADALTRQALLNDRCDELADRLRAPHASGSSAAELAAQLDVVEARRSRAMALACEASQRLSRVRQRLRDIAGTLR